MASTRNKNSVGDYKLEQHTNLSIRHYSTTPYYGEPNQTLYAGDGLLVGRMASNLLSTNACDSESQLLGIGSTNLVSPKEDITPQLKRIPTLNIIEKNDTLLPEPLIVERGRRPAWI